VFLCVLCDTRNEAHIHLWYSDVALPLCEYSALEYVRMHVMYKVHQAEYAYSFSCGCTTHSNCNYYN